jgi:hypothetical protein
MGKGQSRSVEKKVYFFKLWDQHPSHKLCVLVREQNRTQTHKFLVVQLEYDRPWTHKFGVLEYDRTRTHKWHTLDSDRTRTHKNLRILNSLTPVSGGGVGRWPWRSDTLRFYQFPAIPSSARSVFLTLWYSEGYSILIVFQHIPTRAHVSQSL